MAVAQSNAISVTASALPATAKPSAPAASNDGGGDSKFAALLTEATSNAAVKTGKPAASDKKSQVASTGADAKAAPKTQSSDNQSIADQPAGNPAKDSTAVLTAAITASPYSAVPAANDSDASDASGDTDTDAAGSDTAKATAKPAATQPATDQAALSQQPAQIQTPDTQTQAAQAQAAQAQAMLLAVAPATPPSQAPAATASNNNVAATDNSDSSGKTVRNTPATPRVPTPSNQAPSDSANADPAVANPTAANADNNSDPANAQTPIAAAQASLKGHDSDKGQVADNSKASTQPDAAPIPAAAAPPPAQSAPTPQPAAANLGGVTAQAPATNAGAAVATNLHIAPQTATPHMPTPTLDGMAVDIAARSQSGAREFQIRLDPPELGHVDVRLSIDATGKTEAHLTADQPQTLQLLQKDSDTLTRALRDAGLDVSQGSLNFSLKGQDRQGGDNSAAPRTPSLALAATKTIDAVQSSANPYRSSAGDARLDIHV